MLQLPNSNSGRHNSSASVAVAPRSPRRGPAAPARSTGLAGDDAEGRYHFSQADILTTAFLCSFCTGSPTGDVALSDPHDLSVVPTSVNDIPDPFANQSPRER